MKYEDLEKEVYELGLNIYEKAIPSKNIKGLCIDDTIILDTKKIKSTAEKMCILAEEIGHYHTTSGNILNQKSISNRKQELIAHRWAVMKLVTLDSFIEAKKAHVTSKEELAEFLKITPSFLDEAIKHYQAIYGLVKNHKGYTITFSPFNIEEQMFQ